MNSPSLNAAESRWPHRLAVLLVCATFPLLWVGGLVTSYHAGMAVPDWPTTYGYNLFAYPWQTWVLGPWDLFIEHGHRLFAATVGMLTIALVVVVWLSERRRWVRDVALGALALVCIQGLLGGLRVQLGMRALARIHGCVGPLFFGYVTLIAAVTSRWWRAAAARSQVGRPEVGRPEAGRSEADARRLRHLAVTTAAIAYLQIVLGACVRQLPQGTTLGEFRLFVIFHLITAVVLAVHVGLLAARIVRRFRGESLLLRPAIVLCGLLLVQIGLGMAAWVTHYGVPVWFSNFHWAASYTVEAEGPWQIHLTTAHVAGGSLIFATTVLLAARSARLFAPNRGRRSPMAN